MCHCIYHTIHIYTLHNGRSTCCTQKHINQTWLFKSVHVSVCDISIDSCKCSKCEAYMELGYKKKSVLYKKVISLPHT